MNKEDFKKDAIDVVGDGLTDVTDLFNSGRKIFIQNGYKLKFENDRILVIPEEDL